MSIETLYGILPNKAVSNLKKIKLVAFDVDGTLTDGGIYHSNNGDELKKFNAKDGMGIYNISRCNIKTAIITGRESNLVLKRSQELSFSYVYQKIPNKIEILDEILAKMNIKYENVAYLGDDINDLSVIEKVGFSACPNDAYSAIVDRVNYVCTKNAGFGAARELCDLIMIAQGYLSSDGAILKV